MIMAAVAIFICVGVVGRKVFNVNVPDAFDISKHLQGIAIAWGIAMATYYKSHVVVDVVYEFSASTGGALSMRLQPCSSSRASASSPTPLSMRSGR